MKNKIILCLALVLSGGLFGCSTTDQHSSTTGTADDKRLTKQISDVLTECQKIKPGMTRAELLKNFTTEGGISTGEHYTYVYRRCPYIKIDVDFNPSSDVITKVSKPYLDWSIID